MTQFAANRPHPLKWKRSSGSVWRMKTATLTVTLALALALIIPTTTAAATPKQVVKAQRLTIANLKAKLAKVKRDNAITIKGLTDQITELTGQASATEILNSGKDSTISGLQTTNAALTAQVSAQAAGGLAATLAGSPTDLWNAIAAIYGVFPNSSGCGLSKSYYASSPYFNYSFTSYGC